MKHPFPGFPQYTGFDVKGIVMFRGSREYQSKKKYPLYPQNFRASWRLLGDPELMNADGFTYRWSEWYDSGSDMPIFNYWPGKWANGTPTANVNGFLNFYSNENRHMFECNAVVSRTYHIWLPPGPQEAGYAVEACWEPPLVTPVTKPADDFPITANQPEAYRAKFVINDGMPITDPYCCNHGGTKTVHEGRVEVDTWYWTNSNGEEPSGFQAAHWCPPQQIGDCTGGCETFPTDGPPSWYVVVDIPAIDLEDGVHQYVGVFMPVYPSSWSEVTRPAFDIFEITLDLE